MKLKFTVPNAVKAGMSVTVSETLKARIVALLNRGIAYVEVNEDGHLVFMMTDGSVEDLGKVSGEEGFSPIVDLFRFSDGVRITVTNKDSVSSADVFDGKDVQGDITEYVVLDQADYDALTEKKATTLYLIRG